MDQNYGPIPKCPGHDLLARLWSTRKEPIRQFYRCPKPIGEQCNFFAWVDPHDYPVPQGTVLPPTPDSATRTSNGGQLDRPTTPTPLPRMVVDDVGEGDPFQNQGAGPAWPPRTPPWTQNPNGAGRQQLNDASSPGQGTEARHRSETLRDASIQEPTADSISDTIHRLQTLPEYVRRLERKKIAAERSRDAKNSKITNLQEKIERLEMEVERLKAREKELEEVIAAYEIDA